ncbi:MAG: NADPH-dependent assimilatory sulfite reductase hemoprotein subunit [Chitinophagaceae bacterium]|nr:NADPH-dependent assimilatory sulfite reductase hemoprotein subunit [Chitinophagaceae bacterium]
MADQNNLSSTERIKQASDSLRGTLVESLQNEVTGTISDDDMALVRFHGMYMQDDRDRREERASKKLERLFSFMIRLRLPGGRLTPEQWIALHHIAGKNSTGVFKITTRQTIQLHGVLKSVVKPTLKAFNEANLTTIATCGDINRNVLCSSHPKQSALHEEIYSYATDIDKMLLPKTHGYYEIWLDAEKIADKKSEEDPLYQDRYMPRKFKIAIAIPPNNDVDVFGNDLGLIAVVKDNQLKGFNIAIGGGMSATHGNPDHYPRLGSVIGFVDTREKLLKAVYQILTIQRDYGDRSDRKLARMKYTVDRLGLDWWKDEIERRCGFQLEKATAFHFESRKDYYGWEQNHEGLWYYTAFIENGRVLDEENLLFKTAFLEIAGSSKANFILTCNQNLILGDVKPEDKVFIHTILDKYGIIAHTEKATPVRKNAMACVAFNTCPLALAESQRYMPSLLSKIETLLDGHGLSDENIIMRMTGCPNGCARPFIAEVGFVGTALGRYNLHFGGDNLGMRLNKIYKESLDEQQILSELDTWFANFKNERKEKETFGDYTWRKLFN